MQPNNYVSPPSSVYSYPGSSHTGRSLKSSHSQGSINDYSYTMEDVQFSGVGRKACATGMEKCKKYMRRIFKFRQMDFEFALWQMLNLFIAPHKVYRNFQYRKQTKNQFARDDPAFLVLMSIAFCVTSIGFGLTMGLSWFKIFKLLLWVVFIDCIAVGILIATAMWLISNKYLVRYIKGGADVEWAYAFDVHLNAFFPVLMILHCLQLFFINPLIVKDWFLSVLVGNTFWLAALGYYVYITFLGYNVLPFVKKSIVLLSPLLLLGTTYFISLITRWNITKALLWFYENRV
ncbi:protein unc-50 homolog [Styela clava]|uniref:protein unc-50 homolog n=1 Tax=Styela clava TaxID=7725 RepID=UPI00193991F8|nr:protein unc-50 homolog [Styela clava]